MGSSLILDTNVVIDYLNNQLPEDRILWLKNSFIVAQPCLSIITELELLSWPKLSEHGITTIQKFVSHCFIYPLSRETVNLAAALRRNRRISLPDAVIAATAMMHNQTLVTRNVKDFAGIGTIEVINPFHPV